MMKLSTLVIVAVIGSVTASRAVQKKHPIEGVLTLLDELQVKALDEGKVEEENYNKYATWCKESKDTLNTAIATEKAEISSLTSKISSLKDEIDTLTKDIDYLGVQIEEQNSAQAKAQEIRDSEKSLYDDEQKNIDDTISAVKDATKAMEDSEFLQVDQKKKIREAALLTEFKMTPAQHKEVMQFIKSPSFLQESGPEDPPENDYDFKSGGIIATFKGMIEDFEVEKEQSTSEETTKKNNFNLSKKAREDAIKAAEDAKGEKETAKGDKESDKGTAEGSKSEQESALAADTALLDKTTKDCATTDAEWEERSKIRSDEIMAMEMAKKILSKVTKVRNPDEHEIAQKGGGKFIQVSFLQTTALRGMKPVDKKADAVQALMKAANSTAAVHKKALAQLASQLMTFDGPFDKLKSMIQKMIFRLMAEQKDEDDHKNWCDLEVEKSTEAKEDKDSKMTRFTKKLEEMDKAVKKLGEQIVKAEEKAAGITKTMKQETALRNKNHESNVITIKDAKDAQTALNNAISVLTDFYKESGMIAKEPWEFVQLGVSHKTVSSHKMSTRDVELPDSPATWDSSYTGTTDPKSGDQAVLSLLEETNDKFAAMEADATVADTTDQKNYEEDMQASKIELAETKTDIAMKSQKKSSLEEKIEGMTAAKKHTARELSAVEAYLDDLEPACGEGDSSYEDRKQARKDEMEALRKAQNIFEEAFRAKL